ncbi:MAG: hypothetical protein OXB86_05630, partial [Bdellovibrionales bacterium]|nr:hypothetical protein [Bdellovibrionales bacterium]
MSHKHLNPYLWRADFVTNLYRSGFSFPFSYLSFRDDFQGQREVKSSDMRFATEQPSVATVSKP